MAEQFDSSGVQIAPARTLKAVNYTGLIPYLVAAMQEQNTRIDQLQQQLAQCCNDGAIGGHSMQQGAGSSEGTMDTDLRIVPNPVAANTQLRYTVGTPGRVRLEVTDNSGRVIEVLEEATRNAGSFTYDWSLNPSFLSATNVANPSVTGINTASELYTVSVSDGSCSYTRTVTLIGYSSAARPPQSSSGSSAKLSGSAVE